jgi:hypothetical protein
MQLLAARAQLLPVKLTSFTMHFTEARLFACTSARLSGSMRSSSGTTMPLLCARSRTASGKLNPEYSIKNPMECHAHRNQSSDKTAWSD